MSRITYFLGDIRINTDLLPDRAFPVLGWLSATVVRIAALAIFCFLGSLRSDQPDPKSPLLYPLCQLTPSLQRPLAEAEAEGVQSPYIGIWISRNELSQLPTQGTAWTALKTAADKDPGKPDIKDQNNNNDVYVLAKALVYARTGDMKYRKEVIDNLMQAIGTERGGRTLALGRNLSAYVISADLINLPADPIQDRIFRTWLRGLLTENLDGRTLRSTQEDRPNNWGTHAGASRAAVALYLGDNAELDRVATVFKGYLGDRSSYSGFRFGTDLSWQCNPGSPVPIDPKGCVKDGHSLDGAPAEEMRRGATFRWPPVETGYAWEGLQGAVVTAQILSKAGYPAWEWQDQALLRAVKFLYGIGWEPQKDDQWQVWLINRAYGTNFPMTSPTYPGKNIGWTDWTQSLPVRPEDKNVNRVLRCEQ